MRSEIRYFSIHKRWRSRSLTIYMSRMPQHFDHSYHCSSGDSIINRAFSNPNRSPFYCAFGLANNTTSYNSGIWFSVRARTSYNTNVSVWIAIINSLLSASLSSEMVELLLWLLYVSSIDGTFSSFIARHPHTICDTRVLWLRLLHCFARRRPLSLPWLESTSTFYFLISIESVWLSLDLK